MKKLTKGPEPGIIAVHAGTCGYRLGQERAEEPLSKAVIYLRVSTEEQVVEGVSLSAQRERLQAYCAAKGLSVVETIADEGVSATKALDTRPGGKRLVENLKRKDVRHVVALKLDRLFRNAEDALRTTSGWDRRGIALHLVDLGGQSLDTASAIGKMMLTMMAAFAEFERNLVSERTVAALTYKRKHNQAYNHTPFGFTRSDDIFIPADNEMAVVAEIRGLREAGDTFRTIASRLNAQGIQSKKGGVWYPSTVRKVLAIHSKHQPTRLSDRSG